MKHPTKRSTNATLGKTLAAAVLAALLGACATSGGPPQTPEEIVRQRAEARWQALAQRDFKTAYGFITPAIRDAVSYEAWVRRFGGGASWKSAEAAEVNCEEARCVVKIRLQAYPVGPSRRLPLIETYMEETWLYEAGSWWFFQRW